MIYGHLGVDYGAKLAGTTAIAWQNHAGNVELSTAPGKKDADLWLKRKLEEIKPQAIFIDAPLSLPGAFYSKDADFFYRYADRQLRAMSPMFLGGLTARAMQLKSQVNVQMIETYPAALVKELHLTSGYDKKTRNLSKFFDKLQERQLIGKVVRPPDSWHEIDAMLAWISGCRYHDGMAVQFGKPDEGLIFI